MSTYFLIYLVHYFQHSLDLLYKLILFVFSEGKTVAETYDCKYFEVSALMNLRVDELLAGIVNQIRLHRNRLTSGGQRSPVPNGRKSPLGLINRILKRQAPVSKSCDNLLVL